jgi:hypothetical protein
MDRIIFTNIRPPHKSTVHFSITFIPQTDEVQSDTHHTGHEAKSVHLWWHNLRFEYSIVHEFVNQSDRRQIHTSNIPHDIEYSCFLSLSLSLSHPNAIFILIPV